MGPELKEQINLLGVCSDLNKGMVFKARTRGILTSVHEFNHEACDKVGSRVNPIRIVVDDWAEVLSRINKARTSGMSDFFLGEVVAQS